MTLIIGYVRECRQGPGIQRQADILYNAGIDRVYPEQDGSGTMNRILSTLRQGDYIAVTSLHVLAPSRADLYSKAYAVASKGAGLISLEEGLGDAGTMEGFLDLLDVLSRLEAHPEPIDQNTSPDLDAPPEYIPPETGPAMPDGDLRPPGKIPDEIPARAYAAFIPGWIPERAKHGAPAVETIDAWPYWLPASTTRPEPPAAGKAFPAWPAWLPGNERKPEPAISTATGRKPAWMPEFLPDMAAKPVYEAPVPAWIPTESRHADTARPAPAPFPAWLPETPGNRTAYRKPSRLFTIDRNGWQPDGPYSVPVQPRRRLKQTCEPLYPAPETCHDPSMAGILPNDALLRPNARPTAPGGGEVILIPVRPDAEKAIGTGIPDIDRPAEERRPATPAERLVIRQMQEQRRISGIRHAILAAVVAILLLLGILAVSLAKGGVRAPASGAALPGMTVQTESAPSGEVPERDAFPGKST